MDSVRVALTSTDWNERHGALARINGAYPDAFPAALVEPIVALLTSEASASVDHAGDEDFGEYVVDLVLTGVRTRDARAVPGILRLDGLGISSGVAAFVASQGAVVMPALDALARTRDDRASDVVETYALMYTRFGSRLTRADSVRVLRRLIAAASDTSVVVRSQLALVARRGPIAELEAALADLASSDPEQQDGVYVVRLDAGRALPSLKQASDALTTSDLLNRLTLLTDAACDDAESRVQGQCVALAVHLEAAARGVAAGRPAVALQALDVYRSAVRRLAADGLVPRLAAVTLDGIAGTLVGRLSGGR